MTPIVIYDCQAGKQHNRMNSSGTAQRRMTDLLFRFAHSPGTPSDVPPLPPERDPPDIIIVPPKSPPDDQPEHFPPPVPPPPPAERPEVPLQSATQRPGPA